MEWVAGHSTIELFGATIGLRNGNGMVGVLAE